MAQGVSVYFSCSCTMARWWPTFRAETSHQVNTIIKQYVVTGNINVYTCGWYTTRNVSYKNSQI